LSKTGSTTSSSGGNQQALIPTGRERKASAHYSLTVEGGKSRVLRLRLSDAAPDAKDGHTNPFGRGFDSVMKARREEADQFYATVIPKSLSADAVNVMRQALGGMLWSKQLYYYDP
jgi:hypothetical protein